VSTIGAAQDMESEDLRRLYVNCAYWALGLESTIPPKAMSIMWEATGRHGLSAAEIHQGADAQRLRDQEAGLARLAVVVADEKLTDECCYWMYSCASVGVLR